MGRRTRTGSLAGALVGALLITAGTLGTSAQPDAVPGKGSAAGGVQRSKLVRLPPGARAVTVRTDPAGGLGGYLASGGSVDVIVVSGQEGNLTVRTALRNVLVLGVGAGDGTKIPVTLALPAAQAESVILADAQHEIRLAPRPAAPSPAAPAKAARKAQPAKAAGPKPEAPDKPGGTVIVIRGASVELVPLGAEYSPGGGAADTPPSGCCRCAATAAAAGAAVAPDQSKTKKPNGAGSSGAKPKTKSSAKTSEPQQPPAAAANGATVAPGTPSNDNSNNH